MTLGLGLTVNITVFTIFNAAILRPMPITDAARVVRLSVANVGDAQNPNAGVSFLDFQDWRTASRTFEDLAGSRRAHSRGVRR